MTRLETTLPGSAHRCGLRPILLFLITLAAVASPTAWAASLKVKNLSDSGAGSLRQAIADAAPGDTITFSVTGTIPLASQLTINKNLTIQGPGAGLLTISGKDAVRVIGIPSGVAVTLDSLTVTKGTSPISQNGAGINSAGSLTVSRCIFSANNCPSWGSGGAIYSSGPLAISSSTFTGNNSSFNGGAVYSSGPLVISSSTYSGNNSRHNGGAIYSTGSLSVSHSLLSNNEGSGNDGGGILSTGPLTVSYCTFSGNRCGTNGGGLGIEGGTATVSDTTFAGNSCFDGGGLNNFSGTLTLTRSTFYGNTVFAKGAGFLNNATATVSNCTFSGNNSSFWGGGFFNFGAATVTTCTFSGNSAPTGGNVMNSIGSLKLRNTILTQSPSGGNLVIYSGKFDDQGHNLDSDASSPLTASTSLKGVDPKLGPLANNGGPTLTHALLPTSPALDAGDNTGAPPTDQRGLNRIVDADGDGFSRIDIGAYERQASADLALSIGASPSPVKRGDLLRYTLVAHNYGPDGAGGVVVTTTLPSSVAFREASTTQGSLQTPAVGNTGTLTANLGALGNGEIATVTVTVQVVAPKEGTLVQTATVSGSTPDPAMSNNSATVTTTVK